MPVICGPVDVARNMLGQFASQEAVDALNERLGMDKPPVERYLGWLGRVLAGDFGESTSQRGPVGPLILKHAVNTGILAGAALLLLGHALRRGREPAAPRGAPTLLALLAAFVLVTVVGRSKGVDGYGARACEPGLVQALIAALLAGECAAHRTIGQAARYGVHRRAHVGRSA